MVLQDEVLGVGPVVRDVTLGVVAHHVRGSRIGAGRIGGIQATLASRLGLADEAVHLPAVDVGQGVDGGVRPAAVDIGVVDIGGDAGSGGGVVHAHGRPAVLHGDAVGPRKGCEVRVEGPVLLHDHDDVLDLVHAGRDDVAAGRTAAHPFPLDDPRRGGVAARSGHRGQGHHGGQQQRTPRPAREQTHHRTMASGG